MNRLQRRVLAALVAAVALPLALGLAPAASGHVSNPPLDALHAFVGDPLWGLDTPQGTLLAVNPDERTAQASTTKLMTLHLTVLALEQGVVHLDYQVTIDALVAGVGGSFMADVNGVKLEEGEVVSLATLIRGMMYPSGNNAAWAIAEHVARAYLGPNAGVQDFVDMMNQHALADGLVDTHFTSPNGFDDPYQAGVTPAPNEYNHFTTARELAKLMNHAIQDPMFQQIVGFQGTYTDTSQGPNGPKTYMFGWGFNYPGWEGAKGGGTQNCNGPNNGCMAMSAKRLGRRVVFGFMQGEPWDQAAGLFDYGFATIFHPDPHGGTGAVSPAISQIDLNCWSSSRAASATLEAGGPAKLTVWNPAVGTSTIGKLADAALPGSAVPKGKGNGQGPPRAVALTRLASGDVIMAFRKGAGVELSRWSIAPNGTPQLLVDGVKDGPATTMALQPVYGNMFLSVMVNPDGALVLKSWALEDNGLGFTLLDTYQDASRVYQEAAVAGPDHTDVFNGHRAITAAQDAGGATVHDVWAVDAQSGAITKLGELVENGVRSGLSIAPIAVDPVFDGELFPPVYYATGYRTGGGNWAFRVHRIDAQGTPVNEGSAGANVATEDVRLASLGDSGLLVARRAAGGDVDLTVWEARRQDDDSVAMYDVSDHPAFGDASSLGLCRVPSTHADGDYLTADIGASDSLLRLRAFRSGDRP
jgi:D-alanyl-D-alanine carboxypeptidase